jgi:hypothetical protein
MGGDCGGTGDGNGPNSGCGDVYKLTPGGVETQLYDFNDTDMGGSYPLGPVAVDSAGNIYGTTTQGGASGGNGPGVLFKITSANHETVLRAFSSGTDGYNANGVTLAPDGNLYGTSNGGGAHSWGTIWGYGLAAVTQTLTVSITEGTGASGDTVTVGSYGTCSSGTCNYSIPQGTAVTLTANTATNDSFTGTGDGWGGACRGDATTCTITMGSSPASVTATFSYVPAQTPTTTVVSCTPNPSQYQQSVTCTATVTGTQGTPTGSVTFYNGATALGTGSLSAGSASYSTTTLQVGSNSITAIYSGDSNNQSSTSAAFVQAVTTIPTTVSCSYSAPIAFGTGIPAANCTVTPNVPGTYTYNPPLGAVFNASATPYTIGITFTPTDTTHYASSTTTASLTINKAAPVITWDTPKPITYGTALSGTQLNPYASNPFAGSVYGSYSYTAQLTSGGPVLPAPAGTVLGAGSWTLTATFTPNDTKNYTTATGSIPLTVNQATPVITWSNPAAITYGTLLSSTQLNAAASGPLGAVAGTYVYSPAAGALLGVGSQTLTVNFTPTDTTDYATPAQASVTLQVNQATPVITWVPPTTTITYGTNLSAILDATDSLNGSNFRSRGKSNGQVKSNVADGTFAYTLTTVNGTPVDGTTVLNASSTPYTLWVTFTPNDTTDYTPATASITLTVTQATPVITWVPPTTTITYGTNLSTILDATDSLSGNFRSKARANQHVKRNDDGTFVYTLADGTPLSATTVLSASSTSYTLVATFTPTDTTDYTAATASVTLTVNQATPVITWATPAAITYGTALSGTQLNATSNVAGSFVYSPVSGTVLGAGSQTLTAAFTPTDTTDYNTPNPATVTLTVNKATPTCTWTTPVPITTPTPLSATQLDATCSVPGSYVYTPPAGTVLNAGPQTLSVTFTPTDTTDYNMPPAASVTLQVIAKKLKKPSVSITAPSSEAYNSSFTVTATTNASTPAYITVSGACSISGTTSGSSVTMTASTGFCTLSATWAADDVYEGLIVTKNVTAKQATPVISWGSLTPIVYGTALGTTQLDATANVAGTFAYAQSAGAVLKAGAQTLKAVFTPTDTADYATVKATANLTVTQATTTTTINSVAPSTKHPLEVTVDFTAAGQYNAKVTGDVTVTANTAAGESCSGAVSATTGTGKCTITFTSASELPTTLTAVYAGDTNNSTSTSAPFAYPQGD